MSHDFDYIVYVPFRNYAGWPGGAWLGTVLVQLVYSTAGVWWEKYGTFDSQEQ